jgi:serine/threonine protein kinase
MTVPSPVSTAGGFPPPPPGPSPTSTASSSNSESGHQDAVDPYVGRTIASKFEIIEVLGQGGMGKVYKARHVSLDKIICIKMLRPALLEDQTIVGRFAREAKAASRLNHAHSIQVLDFGQDEIGTLYIAMEYVSGKDLRKTLRDEFPLGEERICHIVAQILSALIEAHAQNVIHRDLKPENIMIEQRRGEPDFVKVLDFGIAKIQDPDVPGLTRADVVCGTPLYMSPEQATGSKFDHRADLYAMGIILYQLSTGTLPFDGDNSMEILTKHVTELPVPPRTRRPEVSISPDMEALILRAMDKDPDGRPVSAEEFRNEVLAIRENLKRARQDAEALAKQANTAHKAERAQALKDKQAAQLAQMRGASTVTAPPAAKSRTPVLIGIGLGVLAIAGVVLIALRPGAQPATTQPAITQPATLTVTPPITPVVQQPVAPAAVVEPIAPRPTPPRTAQTVTPPNSEPRIVSPKPVATPVVKQTPPTVTAPTAVTPPVKTTPVVASAASLPPLRKGDAVRAKAIMADADIDFEESDYKAASEKYRQAIGVDPSCSDAYYGLFRTGVTSRNKSDTRLGGEGFLRAAPTDTGRTKKVRETLDGL